MILNLIGFISQAPNIYIPNCERTLANICTLRRFKYPHSKYNHKKDEYIYNENQPQLTVSGAKSDERSGVNAVPMNAAENNTGSNTMGRHGPGDAEAVTADE